MLLPEALQQRLGVPTLEGERRKRVLVHVTGALLDVACGHNRLVREYRQRSVRAYGCDEHLWLGIDVRADAGTLPFRSESFDTVTIVAALNHISSRERAVAEATRVLRPGGRLVVTMIGPVVGRLSHWLTWWDPDVQERGMRGGERAGLTRSEVLRLASRSGLVCVREERFVAGLNRLYVFMRARGS